MPLQTDPDDLTSLIENTEPLTQEPQIDPTPVVTAPAASMTAADIATAIKAAFPAAAPATVAPPKLSDAEVAKLLKSWEPDDAFLERFDNIATKKDAIKELFTRAADHAEARAQVHTYGETQRLEQAYAPRLKAFEEWQATQREARFNSKYAELSKKELKPVVSAAAASVFSRQTFADEESAFDAVARESERIIQSHAPEFKLAAPKRASANPNELPTTTSGSGGGGGGQPAPRTSGPRGIDLFAPVEAR